MNMIKRFEGSNFREVLQKISEFIQQNNVEIIEMNTGNDNENYNALVIFKSI